MKLDANIAVELGNVVKDEREYVNLMVRELNTPIDNSLSKIKIYEKYKTLIIQKYGKPAKYPCLVVNYNNDMNEMVCEILYKQDLQSELKELQAKVKKIQAVATKLTPATKKKDYSFL